jgi:tetratricopeptide (TPR) repeat protein
MASKNKAKKTTNQAKKNVAKPALKSAKKSLKPVVKKTHKSAPPASAKAVKAVAKAKPKAAVKASKSAPSKIAAQPPKFGKLAQATNKIKPMVAQKPAVRPISGAIKALEAGIKLMYAEQYDKAIKCFNELISDYPDEVEIQASARANIHACENKRNNRAKAVIRTADDHYHMAVAFLNGGQLDSAMGHLQQALKLEPKGGHILYAIAAANALKGNKEQAISFLKQSIHHGPENRFHAAQDNDFATLIEEPGFRELLTPSGK